MLRQYLETGRIVSTHGLEGEVRVQPWCDSPEFLTGFDRLYFQKGASSRAVRSARVHKSLALIRFEGVDDVNAAAKLVGSVVYIDRALVTLPEGSYFEQDLIGLAVVDADSGREYGTLASVMRTGANDVYAVRGEGGEVLIPAIRDVIREVDLAAGRMLITPLKGLFDDAD